MSTILRTVWLGFLDGSIAGDGKRIKDNLTKNSNDTDKKPLTSVNISTFPKNRISEALSLFLGSAFSLQPYYYCHYCFHKWLPPKP